MERAPARTQTTTRSTSSLARSPLNAPTALSHSIQSHQHRIFRAGAYLGKVLKNPVCSIQMISTNCQAEHFERPFRMSLSSGSHWASMVQNGTVLFSAGQYGSERYSDLSPQETQSTAGRWRAGEQKHFKTWVLSDKNNQQKSK